MGYKEERVGFFPVGFIKGRRAAFYMLILFFRVPLKESGLSTGKVRL